MNLSEMKQTLIERDIRLTRSLGQNFLHDANQLLKIVAAAELRTADSVLEIGPGLGPLTELLVARAGQVVAIEKDRRLYTFLKERFASCANLRLVHDDALVALQNQSFSPDPQWKVVSNLPYSIASRILVELTLSPSGPARVVVTLQKEVADRANAEAGQGDYGILSLLTQLNYASGAVFKISRYCFFPEPDVDSACLILDRRAHPPLSNSQAVVFREIVKRAFSQRRKMMFKILKTRYPEEVLKRAWEQIGLSEQIRAERVTLDEFIALAKIAHLQRSR